MTIKTFIQKIKDSDITSLIETLKNIDAKDLKSIDVEQIKIFFQNRLDTVINVGLILMTFVIIINISGGHKKKASNLKKEVAEMQKNFEEFKVFKAAQKQYKNFVKNFPEALSSDQLIDEIFDAAINHNVQILSFSPIEEKSDDFAKFTRVNISITSDNYADIVRFVHDMENTAYSIQIEKLESERNRAEQDKTIKVSLAIGSVKLKK